MKNGNPRKFSKYGKVDKPLSPPSPDAIDDMSRDEVRALIEELQLHQAKLENQNEELKQTRRALEEARNRYAGLFNDAPVGYVILDARGRIRQANQTFADMAGNPTDRLAGCVFADFIETADRSIFLSRYRDFFENPADKRIDVRIFAQDGRVVQLSLEARRESGDEQQSDRLLVIAADVTDRRQAERRVRESEARLRRILENMPIMMAGFAADGTVAAWNRECEQVTGYSAEEIIGNPEVKNQLFSNAAYRDGLSGTFPPGDDDFRDREIIFSCKGNTQKIVSWSNVSRRSPIPGWASWAVGIDLTMRKQMDNQLLESRENLDVTLNSIADAVIAADTDGRIVRMNPVAERLTEWPAEAALGRRVETVFSLVNAKTRRPVGSPVEKALRLGCVVGLANHTVLVSKSGVERQIADSAAPIRRMDGSVIGAVLVFRDVSDEYRSKEELRFQAMILNQIRDLVLATDLRGLITYANEAEVKSLKRPLEKLIGMNVSELGEKPGEGARQSDILEALKQHGEWRGEVVNFDADGSEIILDARVWGIRDEDGNMMAYCSVSTDVTENRRAEQALKESESRYRTLAENLPKGALFLIDRDLRYLFAAGKALAEAGLSKAEVEGKTLWEVFPPPVSDIAGRHCRWIFEGKEVFYEVEYNGRIYENRGVPLIPESGGAIVEGIVITTDITERKKLSDQLRQAQKMEAVGRLAAGVAHDFNNMLSPILGYSEMLMEEHTVSDPRHSQLAEIKRAAERSRDLVRQLLAFSRKQVLEMKSLDINRLVLDFEKMLRRTIREDIEIRIHPEENPGCFRGDVSQIEQALMNLSVNAQDAMPNGGTLTIETARVILDADYASSRPEVTPGMYVLLAVTDNGRGMAGEIREHVFEPFFTTKEKDKGTGLGLATVYGIVKQHGGYIWVYSEPYQGTTFKLYFPVTESPEEPEAETKAGADRHAPAGETIMIVEDDPMVRRLAAQILKRCGYRVIEAENPVDCLKHIERGRGPIHLLLTDVILPDMDGRRLFEHMQKSFPDLKVLYMSGYTDNVILDRGVLKEGTRFIQKPFSVKVLEAKIRNILDE